MLVLFVIFSRIHLVRIHSCYCKTSRHFISPLSSENEKLHSKFYYPIIYEHFMYTLFSAQFPRIVYKTNKSIFPSQVSAGWYRESPDSFALQSAVGYLQRYFIVFPFGLNCRWNLTKRCQILFKIPSLLLFVCIEMYIIESRLCKKYSDLRKIFGPMERSIQCCFTL